MGGMGGSRFGSTPYGYGSIVPAPIPGGVIFRQTIDGTSQGSRFIDPVLKQYVFDQYGRALGMPNVVQLVQLALTTVKNSSAQAGLGFDQSLFSTIDQTTPKRADAAVRSALSDLVTQNLVSIISITTNVQVNTLSRLLIAVKWTDLTTGQEHDSTV